MHYARCNCMICILAWILFNCDIHYTRLTFFKSGKKLCVTCFAPTTDKLFSQLPTISSEYRKDLGWYRNTFETKQSSLHFPASECYLFKAKVSEAWPGFDDPSALSFDTCFTAWFTNLRRILPVATTASSTSDGSSSDNAVKGYISKNLTHCFVSGLETSPTWRAHLGVSKKVAQVRVHVRQDDTIGGFLDVEARLGDSPVYEDNAVFDFKTGEPVVNAEVLFTPSEPSSGQYFFLRSQGSSSDKKLAFCSIEILEQELDPMFRCKYCSLGIFSCSYYVMACNK